MCDFGNKAKTTQQYTTGILDSGAELGFYAPNSEEIHEARDLAVRSMGCEVADAEAFARIIDLQPAAVLVARQNGRLSGVVATLLLRDETLGRLATGHFSGRSPQLCDLARPHEKPPVYYIWGVAGDTRTARGGAMELCRQLRYQVLANLTAFTTSATSAGRRAAITRLGFGPTSVSDDLLVSLPINGR